MITVIATFTKNVFYIALTGNLTSDVVLTLDPSKLRWSSLQIVDPLQRLAAVFDLFIQKTITQIHDLRDFGLLKSLMYNALHRNEYITIINLY